MKRLLIVLLVLLLVFSLAACAGNKDSDGKDSKKDKTSDTAEQGNENEPEPDEGPEPNPDFEFAYNSLKLKVSSVEDFPYDPENESIEAPEGKYVLVSCNILEGEEATGELGGLYDCLKMNGYAPVSIGTSGVMNLKSGAMYVCDETILTFRFDVPEDFDITRPYFTAE